VSGPRQPGPSSGGSGSSPPCTARAQAAPGSSGPGPPLTRLRHAARSPHRPTPSPPTTLLSPDVGQVTGKVSDDNTANVLLTFQAGATLVQIVDKVLLP
jgi:hypothetical protein